MLVSELKSMDEIKEILKQEQKIFFLACLGCSDACKSSSKEELDNLEEALKSDGKTITGRVDVDFLCNKVLVKIKFLRNKDKWEGADSILVFSCGVGVQAVSKIIRKTVYPAANTKNLGGFQGVWPGEERCAQCGNCVLDLTAGICPYTSCAKSMLNGPCGGSNEGECEVEKGRDCGWYLIYERLKAINKLADFKKIRPLRDHSRMLPKKETRGLDFYAIDR
ncbi:MAG: methylenetetrahydrofolate reductase C-terminal domain-containing protein [Candidatus Omnitrophica bacterium]|nr:methylenetetrahydrofolate reductase C-terminal domain-containing protein [Candidatus Omnitrophota bacterium]MBU1925245.1 methylenetetrahydrofolate reductase C-terminal domain-containing protein [Candidatus Omnitrophota bacterium]